tara:strand:- start:7511 stop:8155 length:645 start_codon:yes stop_codon:yes gene_type:complete
LKTYKVKLLEKSTKDLLNSDDSIWENANSLIDFSSPWDNKPVKKIDFKALHNCKDLFFQFKVFDEDVYIYPSNDNNESINKSDRVELFFRTNKNLNPYYCLEIDPKARIMDFKAQPNKKFDFNWNWPENHIKVISNRNENSFTVEITISIQALKALSLLKENIIETGIYRAKYNKIEGEKGYQPTWITWVDPNTNEPNFHIKSSFGVLELENFI